MSEPDDTARRSHVRYIAMAGVLIVAATWIRQLWASLWLDELGTYWVIKDGLGDTIDRAIEYHGQSPAYYVVAWITTKLGGTSEPVLRLPSVIATAVMIFLLWRVVRRLVGTEAALLSVIGALALTGIAAAAIDARPYAIALLCTVGAVDAFTCWLDGGRLRWGIIFVAFAVATVWFHYLFALALLPLFLYGILVRRDARVGVGRQLAAWVLVGVCVLPLAAQLASLYDRRGSLSIPYSGTVIDLLLYVVPPVLIAGAGLGLLLARASSRVTVTTPGGHPRALFLFSMWAIFPPAVLVAVSLLGGADLYSARYYVSAAPGAAALFGWAVSLVAPPQARRGIVVVTAVLAVLAGGGALRYGEDWRGAAVAERALADDDTLVFLHPAFVESAQIDWLRDPVRSDYLLSPLDYYAMDGEIQPMPYVLEGDDVVGYLEEMTELAEGTDRFLLVTRYPFVPFREWWDGRLSDLGWRSEVVSTDGVIQIVEFTRDEGAPPPS